MSNTYAVSVDKREAALLLEMTTKNAVAGGNARAMANLHDKAKNAARYHGLPVPPDEQDESA